MFGSGAPDYAVRMIRPFGNIVVALALLASASRSVAADPTLGREVLQFVKVRAPVIVLKHVRIIDGTGAAPRDDQTITIEGTRIRTVGKEPATVPQGAMVLDLTGYTAMPGLVGMHDHLFYPVPVPSEMSLEVATRSRGCTSPAV